jgi:hypothetical protein
VVKRQSKYKTYSVNLKKLLCQQHKTTLVCLKIGQAWAILYTVPKTRQVSEKIREEVPWRESFPVIRGNDDYFPRITGKFSLQGTSPLYLRKSARFLGQCIELAMFLLDDSSTVLTQAVRNYVQMYCVGRTVPIFSPKSVLPCGSLCSFLRVLGFSDSVRTCVHGKMFA